MFDKKDDKKDPDEGTEVEAKTADTPPVKPKSTPKPPYGSSIAKRFRNTPFEELPDHLKKIVRGD